MTSFYKGAISKPQKLRRPLVVNFVNTGEIGSDAGALRKEFFEDAIREVNDRLFEGEDTLWMVGKYINDLRHIIITILSSFA